METTDFVTLKWGTLKSWEITSKKGKELIDAYVALGTNYSAMSQKDTPEQKKIICELIDLVPGEIYLEWDDRCVTKEEAKNYINNYSAL